MTAQLRVGFFMDKGYLLSSLDIFISAMQKVFGKLPPDLLETFKEIRNYIVSEEAKKRV